MSPNILVFMDSLDCTQADQLCYSSADGHRIAASCMFARASSNAASALRIVLAVFEGGQLKSSHKVLRSDFLAYM